MSKIRALGRFASCVRTGYVKDGPIFSTEETITNDGLEHSSAKLLPTETLLVALYGANVGKLGLLKTEAATNQAVCAIFTSQHIDRDFLFFFLLKERDNLIKAAFGGAQPNISQDLVRALQVPLAPLPDQKRIATILTDRMAAIDRARAAAQAQLQAAKDLPAAYLRAVFDSPEAQKWPRQRLGDVGEIGSGITLGPGRTSSSGRLVPYLRVANVKDGRLDLSDVREVPATETEINKCRLRYGDLLLTEGGDPDKLGRGTLWEEQLPECIHQNHIYRVRFDAAVLSPQFVSFQISSRYGKAYFLSHAKQTTGIATINQQVLSNFPMMVPPLAEQQRVITEITSCLEGAERLSRTLADRFQLVSALPAALLRQAFNGEL